MWERERLAGLSDDRNGKTVWLQSPYTLFMLRALKVCTREQCTVKFVLGFLQQLKVSENRTYLQVEDNSCRHIKEIVRLY